MEIPTFEYMRFAKTVPPGARTALTSSGLSAPPADWLGDPRDLFDLTDAGAGGTRFLRERIAARYEVRPDDVFVTPGASAAIHLVAGALGAPGRTAIVESPCYPPLELEPRVFGCAVHHVARRREDGYRLDPNRLEAALRDSSMPAMVLATHLHNPSGAAIGKHDLVVLAEKAAGAGARLVSCEVYADFLGSARGRCAAAMVPGAVTIGSLTKAFGLGALRIGWIVCRDPRVIEQVDRRFDHLDVNCAMPSMKAAAAVFDAMPRFEKRAEEIAAAGRAVFLDWVRRESARVSCVEPAAGIMAFPKLEGVRDTVAFAKALRAKSGVQVTPGEFFGAAGHLRIGFGIAPAALREALDAISAALPAPVSGAAPPAGRARK